MKRMDGSPLADAIDAADSLLEPHRIPRQLEIDDGAAGVMKIEALGRGVRRQKNSRRPGYEGRERGCSLGARQPAMQHSRAFVEMSREMRQRVAVLGKDDDRFSNSRNEFPYGGNLGFSLRARQRGISQSGQEPALVIDVAQAE